MQAHHPFRQLLAHFETFWDTSSKFEKFWANLSNFEQFWAILSSFEQFFRASLGNFEQFWIFMSGKFGSCRAIRNNLWKHDMALLTLDNIHIRIYAYYTILYIYIYIYWLMIRRRKYTRPICPFQGLAASLDLALSAGSPWKVTQELQLGQHLESRNCSLERQRWSLVVT